MQGASQRVDESLTKHANDARRDDAVLGAHPRVRRRGGTAAAQCHHFTGWWPTPEPTREQGTRGQQHWTGPERDVKRPNRHRHTPLPPA